MRSLNCFLLNYDKDYSFKTKSGLVLKDREGQSDYQHGKSQTGLVACQQMPTKDAVPVEVGTRLWFDHRVFNEDTIDYNGEELLKVPYDLVLGVGEWESMTPAHEEIVIGDLKVAEEKNSNGIIIPEHIKDQTLVLTVDSGDLKKGDEVKFIAGSNYPIHHSIEVKHFLKKDRIMEVNGKAYRDFAKVDISGFDEYELTENGFFMLRKTISDKGRKAKVIDCNGNKGYKEGDMVLFKSLRGKYIINDVFFVRERDILCKIKNNQ